jgi:cytosine/uracil/thiamine/allantoin permease
LDGADLSFYVGFVVAAAVYLGLHKLEVPNPAAGRGEIGKPHVGASDTA